MAMLERESNREKNLAAIDKEKKVKLKKMEAEAKAAANKDPNANDSTESDAKIAELETEFYEMLKVQGGSKGEGTSEGPTA